MNTGLEVRRSQAESSLTGFFSSLLIEREVRYAQVGGLERARRWRSLLAGRHFPDLAADIQADRSR